MSLAVFDNATYPPIHEDAWEHDRPVVVARFVGGGAESRAALISRHLHRYSPRWRRSSAVYAYIRAFLIARGFSLESFLWKDLRDYARTGVALGTAVAAQVLFPLPATGTHGGDYPIDDVNAILYANGSPVTKTVQTDARTITAASAPGAGVVMTADYHYRRRVRIDSPARWSEIVYGTYAIALELQEVAYES